jgi:hypothetical protein
MTAVVVYARRGRDALALGPDCEELAALKARLIAKGYRLVARPVGSLRQWAERGTPGNVLVAAEQFLAHRRTDDDEAQ